MIYILETRTADTWVEKERFVDMSAASEKFENLRESYFKNGNETYIRLYSALPAENGYDPYQIINFAIIEAG